MAIKKEILESGFIRTYSDANRVIEREDGVRFTEAVEREGSTHTYTETDEEIPPNPFATKYSARSILRELRELGKYEAFRALLTQIGYDWEFLSANYLAEDDTDFKRLKSAVVDAGIVSSMEELDTMLAKCLWTAE